VQHYPDVERTIGRRFDIVKAYVGWQPGTLFPNAQQAGLATGGKRILEFSWNAQDYKTRAKVSYQSIANGDWDASVIRPEAEHLKAFHRKVFIDFDHEFDIATQAGKGSAAQYVAAYRHIHRVFRQVGVKNAIWVWVSSGFLGHAQQIASSYPGSAYVNWVGYDPYNFAQCHAEGWRSPYQTFQPFYRWLQTQPDMRNKPIMLGEYASAPGPSVGSWYAHVARALKHLPRIKAVIQWSSAVSGCDFRLTDSAAAMAGFAKSSVARYITGAK
jgi:beta-mannanase